MIIIYTAERIEDLRHKYKNTSHYEVLWMPENECHPVVETRKIRKFIRDNYNNSPLLEIYTLRETAVNIIGHMIAMEEIDYNSTYVVIATYNKEYRYNGDGNIVDWPYGFYLWNMKD